MSRTTPIASREEIRERKLLEMSQTVRHTKDVLGIKLFIDPDVYAPATDTYLMMNNVEVQRGESALDIGTGTGAIAFKLALAGAKDVLGIDLNPRAIVNARANKQRLGVQNVEFRQGDVFENVEGKFDIIVFNPPYSGKAATNDIDICFYDEDHVFVRTFFKNLRQHLKPRGKTYIAWSNLGDVDLLPALSEAHGFTVEQIAKDVGGRGYEFYVYKLTDKL